MTIRNPIEWSGAQIAHTAQAAGSLHRSLRHIQDTIHSPAPAIRSIGAADVRDALRRGYEDFAAYRSDVIFLCVTYVVAGLLLSRLAFGMNLVPLLFPLASGFALIGPFVAIGLYEMSRRRERGQDVGWFDAFAVTSRPAFGAIVVLGLGLVALFLAWIGTAWAIYSATLGPELPRTAMDFVRDTFTTAPGLAMMGLGVAAGFVFALVAMTLGVVSFPLLIDRDVGLDTAVKTSIRAVRANLRPLAYWGLLVTAGLVLGSIPFFLGLVVVLPVLGHATWHLYRELVA